MNSLSDLTYSITHLKNWFITLFLPHTELHYAAINILDFSKLSILNETT